MNTGVIDLSEDFDALYSEELKKNNIHVVPLTIENYEQKAIGLDAIIVRENSLKDTAKTCNILIKLRERTNALVWVFPTSSQKLVRTIYLELGAVGIIPEDCEANELQLIISNNLEKKKKGNDKVFGNENTLSSSECEGYEYSKELQLVPRNHSVRIVGKGEIPLTRLEYKIMDILYKNMNNAVSYEELYEAIWGKEFNNQNYRVANLIFHLRGKIERSSVNPEYIRTVRSKGYMLDLAPPI